MQESADLGEVQLGGLGVVKVDGVPAAVGGVVAHGVAFVGEQLPQCFGRVDVAGEAAAHTDDDDRVVVGGDGRCGNEGCAVPAAVAVDTEPDADLGREGGGGGVVEDSGHGQAQTGGRADPVAQFNGGERVEAHVAEGPAGLHRAGGAVAEDEGSLGAHQLRQLAVTLGGGQGREAPAQPVATARGGVDGGPHGRGAHQSAEQRCQGPLFAQRGRVEADRDGVRAGKAHRGVEEGETLLGGQRPDTHAPHAVEVSGTERAGHGAAVGPQPPGQGVRGQPLGTALLRERVEEGIRRRVAALPRRAEDARGRGEEHEQPEVTAAGELVQVPGRVQLRAEDRLQTLRGKRGKDTVVQGSGGMHHTAQPVEPVQEPAEGHAVGGVTGLDTHGGTEPGQFGRELPGPRRVLAAAAGEHQIPHAVPSDQVAGHGGPDDACATGHQDGAVQYRARVGQDDLANVPGLAHVPEGLRCLAGVPRGDGQRHQLPAGEESGQVREHLTEPVGARLTQVEGPVPHAG